MTLQMLAPKPLRTSDSVLSTGRLLSEPHFVGTSASFVLALGVFVYVVTIKFALQLWATHTPRWVFLVLAGVAISQLGNMLIMTLCSMDNYAFKIRVFRFLITLGDWVLEWFGFCGFAVLNWYRFRAMCKDSRPWLVHFISFLLFVQVAAWTGVAVTRCVAQWVPADSVILIPKVRFAMVSAVYELDAIANCIMSLAFIYHLRSLYPSPAHTNSFLAPWRPKTPPRSPSGASDVVPVVSRPNSRTSSVKSATEGTGAVVLYESMSQMLIRSQMLLFFECAFTLAVTIIQVVDLTVDPLWFLMSCAQPKPVASNMVMSASAPLQMLAPKPYRSNDSSTLTSRGLVSEPHFFWSAGSFVFGLGVHIYVYTIHYALVLWWTHSPRWVFLALAGVAATQLGNVLIMNLTTDAPNEPMIQFLITLTDWVLEWLGFCGFAWLNWYRFQAMCRESRPWLVHFISLLLFLQIGLWTGVAVTRCVAMWVPRDWEIVTKRLAYISSAFILDAIANVFTSLAFIYHLRSLHPSPARGNGLISTWRARSQTLSTMSYTMASNQPRHSNASNISTAAEEGGPVLYASMHQLLWRSQVLLFVESSFTMCAVIIHQVNGDIDPLWFLMSRC
ncbi:hypothetical protein GGF31_000143 [Allomyces arbusculus]|nr:hypothetical protein GGF31_000143 [Allomyces arbusculus]